MSMVVNRDTVIGDLLEAEPAAAAVLVEMGMHCVGCPASRGETLAEACEVHGIDCGVVLEKLGGK